MSGGNTDNHAQAGRDVLRYLEIHLPTVIQGIHESQDETDGISDRHFWLCACELDDDEDMAPQDKDKPFDEDTYRDLFRGVLKETLSILLSCTHQQEREQQISTVQDWVRRAAQMRNTSGEDAEASQPDAQPGAGLTEVLQDIADRGSTAKLVWIDTDLRAPHGPAGVLSRLHRPFFGLLHNDRRQEHENIQTLLHHVCTDYDYNRVWTDVQAKLGSDRLAARISLGSIDEEFCTGDTVPFQDILQVLTVNDLNRWAERYAANKGQEGEEEVLKRKKKLLRNQHPVLELATRTVTGSLSPEELKKITLHEFAQTANNTELTNSPLLVAAHFSDMLRCWRKAVEKAYGQFKEYEDRLDRIKNPFYSLGSLVDEHVVPEEQASTIRKALLVAFEQLQGNDGAASASSTLSSAPVRIGNARVHLLGLPMDRTYVSLNERQTQKLGLGEEVKHAIISLSTEEDFARLRDNVIQDKTGLRRPCSWAELVRQLAGLNTVTGEPEVQEILLPLHSEHGRDKVPFNVKTGVIESNSRFGQFTIPITCPTAVTIPGRPQGTDGLNAWGRPLDRSAASFKACVPLCFVARVTASGGMETTIPAGDRLQALQRQHTTTLSLPVFQRLISLHASANTLARQDADTLAYHVSPAYWERLIRAEVRRGQDISPLAKIMARYDDAPAVPHEKDGDLLLDPGQMSSPAEFDACILWQTFFSDRWQSACFVVCESHLMHLSDFARYSFRLDLNTTYHLDQSNVSGVLKAIHNRFSGRQQQGVRAIVMRIHAGVAPHDIARALDALRNLPSLMTLVVYNPITFSNMHSLGCLQYLPKPSTSTIVSVREYIDTNMRNERGSSSNPSDRSSVYVCSMVPRSFHQLVAFQSTSGRSLGNIFLLADRLAQSNKTLASHLHPLHRADISAFSHPFTSAPATIGKSRQSSVLRWPLYDSLEQRLREYKATRNTMTVVVVVEQDPELVHRACTRISSAVKAFDCRSELDLLNTVENFDTSSMPPILCFQAAHLLAWRTRERLMLHLAQLAKKGEAPADWTTSATPPATATGARNNSPRAFASVPSARASHQTGPTPPAPYGNTGGLVVVMHEHAPDPRYSTLPNLSTAMFRYGLSDPEELIALTSEPSGAVETQTEYASQPAYSRAVSATPPRSRASHGLSATAKRHIAQALLLCSATSWLSAQLLRALGHCLDTDVAAQGAAAFAQHLTDDLGQNVPSPVALLLFHVTRAEEEKFDSPAVDTSTETNPLDFLCRCVANAARLDEEARPLSFVQFMEHSAGTTFATQRVRIGLYTCYLQAVSLSARSGENQARPLDEAMFAKTMGLFTSSSCDARDAGQQTRGLRATVVNTLSLDLLGSFTVGATRQQGTADGDTLVHPSTPAYKLSPFDDWLATKEGLYDAMVSDHLLDWNQLASNWATFPFGGRELAHVLTVGSYPLAFLLSVSPQSLDNILDTGILQKVTWTPRKGVAVSFPRTLLLHQLNGLDILMNGGERLAQSEGLALVTDTHWRSLAASKWTLAHRQLLPMDKLHFTNADVGSILQTFEVREGTHLSAAVRVMCLSLDADLSAHPAVEKDLLSLRASKISTLPAALANDARHTVHTAELDTGLLQVGTAFVNAALRASISPEPSDTSNSEREVTLAGCLASTMGPRGTSALPPQVALTDKALGRLLQHAVAGATETRRESVQAVLALALTSIMRRSQAQEDGTLSLTDCLSSCFQGIPSVSHQLYAACQLLSHVEGSDETGLREEAFTDRHLPVLQWVWLSPSEQTNRRHLLLDAFAERRECCTTWGEEVEPGRSVLYALFGWTIEQMHSAGGSTSSDGRVWRPVFEDLAKLFPRTTQAGAEEAVRYFQQWATKQLPNDLQSASTLGSTLWCLFPGSMLGPPLWLEQEEHGRMTEPDRRLLKAMIKDAWHQPPCTLHPLSEFARAVFQPSRAFPFTAEKILAELEGRQDPGPLWTAHHGLYLMWHRSLCNKPKLLALLSDAERDVMNSSLRQTLYHFQDDQQTIRSLQTCHFGRQEPQDDGGYLSMFSLILTEGLTFHCVAHLLKTVLTMTKLKEALNEYEPSEEEIESRDQILEEIELYARYVQLFLAAANLKLTDLASFVDDKAARMALENADLVALSSCAGSVSFAECTARVLTASDPDGFVEVTEACKAVPVQNGGNLLVNARNAAQHQRGRPALFESGLLSYIATLDLFFRFNPHRVPAAMAFLGYARYREMDDEQRLEAVMAQVAEQYEDTPAQAAHLLGILQELGRDGDRDLACLKAMQEFSRPESLSVFLYFCSFSSVHRYLGLFEQMRLPGPKEAVPTLSFDECMQLLDEEAPAMGWGDVLSSSRVDAEGGSGSTNQLKCNRLALGSDHALRMFSNSQPGRQTYGHMAGAGQPRLGAHALEAAHDAKARSVAAGMLDRPYLIDASQLLRVEVHGTERSRFHEIHCLPGQSCFLVLDKAYTLNRQQRAATPLHTGQASSPYFPVDFVRIVDSLADSGDQVEVLAGFDTFHDAWLFVDKHMGQAGVIVGQQCVLTRTSSFGWNTRIVNPSDMGSNVHAQVDITFMLAVNNHYLGGCFLPPAVEELFQLINELGPGAQHFVEAWTCTREQDDAGSLSFDRALEIAAGQTDGPHERNELPSREGCLRLWSAMARCLGRRHMDLVSAVFRPTKSYSLLQRLAQHGQPGSNPNEDFIRFADLFRVLQDWQPAFSSGATNTLVVGFPTNLPGDLQAGRQDSNRESDERGVEALAPLTDLEQWLVHVLVSPLMSSTKNKIVRVLVAQQGWESVHSEIPSQDRLVSRALANRCPHPQKRNALTRLVDLTMTGGHAATKGNFRGLAESLQRKDSQYGVTVTEPLLRHLKSVAGGALAAYINSLILDESHGTDSERYLTIVDAFSSNCHIVYVKGISQASDLFLKWCCEYTKRWPWRYIFFENLDIRFNFPEIRDRCSMLISTSPESFVENNLWVRSYQHSSKEHLATPVHGRKPLSKGWRRRVENYVCQSQRCVVLLTSPPGAGKTHLANKLLKSKEQEQAKRRVDVEQARGRQGRANVVFHRFDCSDDRLVTESISALLAGIFGRATEGFLVADEFHLLTAPQKEELFRWIRLNMARIQILLIGNRVLKVDDHLMEHLRRVTEKTRDPATRDRAAVQIHTMPVCLTPKRIGDVARKQGQTHNTELLERWSTFLQTLLGHEVLSLRDIGPTLEALQARSGLGGERAHTLQQLLHTKCPYLSHEFVAHAASQFDRALLQAKGAPRSESNSQQSLMDAMLAFAAQVALGLASAHTCSFAEFSARPELQNEPVYERCREWLRQCTGEQEAAERVQVRYTWIEQEPFPFIRPRKAGDKEGMSVGIGGDYTNIAWVHECVVHSRPVNWKSARKCWHDEHISDLSEFEELVRDCPNKYLCLEAVTTQNLISLCLRSDQRASNGPGLLLEHMASVYRPRTTPIALQPDEEVLAAAQKHMFTLWRCLLFHIAADVNNETEHVPPWLHETTHAVLEDVSALAATFAWASKQAESLTPVPCGPGGDKRGPEKLLDLLAHLCLQLTQREGASKWLALVLRGPFLLALDACLACPSRRAQMLPALWLLARAKFAPLTKHGNRLVDGLCALMHFKDTKEHPSGGDDGPLRALRDDQEGGKEWLDILADLYGAWRPVHQQKESRITSLLEHIRAAIDAYQKKAANPENFQQLAAIHRRTQRPTRHTHAAFAFDTVPGSCSEPNYESSGCEGGSDDDSDEEEEDDEKGEEEDEAEGDEEAEEDEAEGDEEAEEEKGEDDEEEVEEDEDDEEEMEEEDEDDEEEEEVDEDDEEEEEVDEDDEEEEEEKED